MLILSNLLISVFLLNAQENSNITIDTNNLYFPNHLLIDTVNLWGREKDDEFYQRRMQGNYFKNSMYSMRLLKLKEPKLFKKYPHEVYRFTWFGYLGTSHNPLSIRIENNKKSTYLISKFITRRKNNETLIIKDTVYLQEKEWQNFKNMIANQGFWDISPVEKTSIIIMDASTWILEGSNDNTYHMVHRQCGRDKEIGKICMFLLELSNINIKKKEFY